MPIIVNNSRQIFRAEGSRFMPGANNIDQEAWEKALKNPLTRHRVKEKVLVVEQESNGLPDNEKEALELVGKTVDKELLETWGKDEKRAKVVKALVDRLVAIDPKVKDEDDKK